MVANVRDDGISGREGSSETGEGITNDAGVLDEGEGGAGGDVV